MSIDFISAISPPKYEGVALWFLFKGYRLLVMRGEPGVRIPRLRRPDDIGLHPIRQLYLGYFVTENERLHCFAGEIEEGVVVPAGYSFENLRPLYSQLDERIFWIAGKAVQIVDWDRTNMYCGRCGQTTVTSTQDRSKVCPNCGLTSYPRLAPAIIVRVQRNSANGMEILLARAKRFPSTMYSVLAGFVEPGETLEECVEREIQEEVGITVRNIHYFGSQPWPFPHSLMVAFTADYESGDINADAHEIADAAWFAPGHLPDIPPPPSIAHKLIASWLDEIGASESIKGHSSY